MTFGRITVKTLARPNREPLHLTFTDQDIFARTLAALGQMERNKEIKVVDSFFGYEIFETVERAVATINSWNR